MPVPGYRLRLFLSVDLAGSTAFKNGPGSSPRGNDPFPMWVGAMRNFYREFPALVAQNFRHQRVEDKRGDEYGKPPTVWKSVGDELLFCVRLNSYEHLAASITPFLEAMSQYGKQLDSSGKYMDVKGAGWIAAFPYPNVTVTSKELPINADYLAEELETQADENPARFDFLGRDIDSGFRVASHASSDRFVCSLELAWLLSNAHRLGLFTRTFNYHGRHILKGVLRDRPYPIICIDTERSPTRIDVRSHERALEPASTIEATKIRVFCDAFMIDEKIDIPRLSRHGMPLDMDFPENYKAFCRSAEITLRENEERGATESEAGNAPEAGAADLPTEVIRLAEEQVQAALRNFPPGGLGTDGTN